MRQPQYDAHWIEQFAQISDGVGDCDCAADLDDIMVPFLSNLYPQMCHKVTAIVQEINMDKDEWALDLEMPLFISRGRSHIRLSGTPSKYSMAMNVLPSSSPTSWITQMLG
jgi:hypothetical protein